jgi:hypothetical protein
LALHNSSHGSSILEVESLILDHDHIVNDDTVIATYLIPDLHESDISRRYSLLRVNVADQAHTLRDVRELLVIGIAIERSHLNET